jgi:hypothetical protein
MARTVNNPILLPAPQASPRAEIAALALPSDEGGQERAAFALQSLFAQHLGALVIDVSPTASVGVLQTPGERYGYRSNTPIEGSLPTSWTLAEVYMYVVRGAGVTDWKITTANSNVPSSIPAAQVNGGATTAGAVWSVGTLAWDDAVAINNWSFEVDTAVGLVAGDGIYWVLIVPRRTQTSLPSVAGGFSNGVIAMDTNWFGGEVPAHSFNARFAHSMALDVFERSGQLISSAFLARTYVGGGPPTHGGPAGADLFDLFIQDVPAAVSSSHWEIHTTGAGTVYVTAAAAAEVTASQVAGGAGWASFDLAVEPQTATQFAVLSTVSLDSVCGWLARGVYP